MVDNFFDNMLKNALKNFLWGNMGKYQIFFVTLQPNSEKDRFKEIRPPSAVRG